MSLGKVTNYGDLWMIHLDIQGQKKKSPAFAHFFAHKIKEFYAEYGRRVEGLQKDMQKLIHEYVQHDDKMQPMSKDNGQGVMMWVFPTEEMGQAYIKQYNNLMATTMMLKV